MFELQVKKLFGAKFEMGRLEDAGYDLYSMVTLTLLPGDRAIIPVGIMTAFPEDYVGLIFDRSSMGRKGISHLAGVIDSGYRGEWGVMLINLGQTPLEIHETKAIAQVVFVPRFKKSIRFVDELPASVRGINWNGSTNV